MTKAEAQTLTGPQGFDAIARRIPRRGEWFLHPNGKVYKNVKGVVNAELYVCKKNANYITAWDVLGCVEIS